MGEKLGRSILLTKHLFHACKVLLHAVNQRHGTDGFTSPPKEGRRAADFITLKIHRPRPDLNPRTLGRMPSTLTTKPPRATIRDFDEKFFYCCSGRHQIACFNVTEKSYNLATRRAEPKRVKTAQNSHSSKASNAVLLT
jgi:hypothetical protein